MQPTTPLLSQFESLDIRTADGWSLRADHHRPNDASDEGVGMAVLAHGVMARRSLFDQPKGKGLAAFLVAKGWHVVAFDFRGHGDSRPSFGRSSSFGYDDLVAHDLATVCAFGRDQLPRGRPLVVVGQSLGGHVALAAQASGAIDADAVVTFGSTPWIRALDPHLLRGWLKQAGLEGARLLARRLGHFPARRLRLGSDDEPEECVGDLVRFARTGAWRSRDGRHDYFAQLARVRVPVLAVVSAGDRVECPPECGEAFARACGGRAEVLRVDTNDSGGPAPARIGLVTGGRLYGVWARVESWMRRVQKR